MILLLFIVILLSFTGILISFTVILLSFAVISYDVIWQKVYESKQIF